MRAAGLAEPEPARGVDRARVAGPLARGLRSQRDERGLREREAILRDLVRFLRGQLVQRLDLREQLLPRMATGEHVIGEQRGLLEAVLEACEQLVPRLR